MTVKEQNNLWSLGWEIHLEFCWILRLIQFRTFWTPEFSSEFYFFDCKMCSCQFWTRFLRFRILSRHRFFRFHEWENVPAIYVSGKWHQILILNAPIFLARTIANPLLMISTWYTQIYENWIFNPPILISISDTNSYCEQSWQRHGYSWSIKKIRGYHVRHDVAKLYFNGGAMIPCNRQRYFDANQGHPQNHWLIVVWCVVCFC